MAGRPRKTGVRPPVPAVKSYGPSKHDSNCQCPRCKGFEVGNQFALGHGTPESHGAYSTSLLKIGPVIEQRADDIRALLPAFHAVDEAALRALATVLIRIERAAAALEQLEQMVDEAGLGPLAMFSEELTLNGKVVRADGLKDDLARWLRVAEKYLSAFGMTPGSRARLGLDLVRARHFTVLDLHRDAEEVA